MGLVSEHRRYEEIPVNEKNNSLNRARSHVLAPLGGGVRTSYEGDLSIMEFTINHLSLVFTL